MIKYLFSLTLAILTVVTYGQTSTTSQPTTSQPIPDPMRKYNNLMKGAEQSGAKIPIYINPGPGSSMTSQCYPIFYTLSKNDYKNQHLKDSLFGTRYNYIREATESGCSIIKICIKRKGFWAGGTANIYYIEDLIQGK